MYPMTARQALRKFGGKDSKCGQTKLDDICASLRKRHGIKVSIAPHVNEEHPKDNFLNAVFEYDETRGSDKAFDELEFALEKRGLAMAWECGGDGSAGPIESYRILGICESLPKAIPDREDEVCL